MSTNTARKAKRQKTDDDSSTAAAEDDRNNASPPTEEDISSALYKIGDTEKYTTDEVNKALDNLYTWYFNIYDNQDEYVRISKEFVELGGIPRILNFFKGNKDHVGFMVHASKAIKWIIYAGLNDEHLENASAMAQQFVKRDGVEMMLSIIKDNYTGELDTDQLETLKNIFTLLANNIHNMNMKHLVDMVDLDKFLPVIDAGLSTMAILSNISTHDTAVTSIKDRIFTFLANFMEFNAEMMDVYDFQEKNIFSECVCALKNPIDNSWNYDKKAWGNVSWFFYQCCCMHRTILSRDSDFEVIIPFLIKFIEENPDDAFESHAYYILRKASDTIGKKEMMTSHKGLLDILGTVADYGNDTVSNAEKDEAMSLLEHLLDKS